MCADRGVQSESGAASRHGEFGDQQHFAPVVSVGDCSSHKGAGNQRDQLGKARQAYLERRTGQTVELEGHGYHGQPRADERHHFAEEQITEVLRPS